MIVSLLALLLLSSGALAYTLPAHSVAGNLNMTSKNIIALATPSNDTDAVTKSYVDTALTTGYLPLAGGTMGGQINFFGIAGLNLSTPVNASDAVIKSYADAINASAYAWTNTTNQTVLDYVNTTNQTILNYVNTTNQTILDYVNSTNQTVLDYVNSSNTSMKSYVDRNYLVSCSSTVATKLGNNSGTILPYGTEISDAYNLWNGTTFTAPVDGLYQIDGSMFTAGYTGNAGNVFSGSVRHNSTDLLTSFAIEVTGTNYIHHRYNRVIYLEANSTIQFIGWKVATSWVKLDGDATHNWITIIKV